MKKHLLLLSTIFITCIAFSQTKTAVERPFVQFGIKAGVNVADMKTDLDPGHQARIGFNGGILAHIHLSPHIALQPEATYSSQGLKQHISSGLDLKMKVGYLNIPLLLQYMYNGFRVETGPQIGFLLNSEADYTDGRKDKLKDYLKPTDVSWDFGLSYLTAMGIGIDGRFNLGLTNINDKLTQQGITNTDMNNRVWQFGLFYQFRR